MRFTRLITTVALATMTVATACSRSDKTDDALKNDLTLAAQQQQVHLDSISALEAQNAALRAAPVAPATVRRTTSSAPRRTSTRSTSSGSTAGTTSGTSAGTVTSTSGGEVTVKHTKRDAAIGAAAGAVIGATTSRDKLKGGAIGAVVGGVLGGVIGNNVDVQKKKPPV